MRDPLHVGGHDFARLRASLPAEDFVDARFDQAAPSKLTDVLYIVSTQRSGSTWLCDLLHNIGACIAHEYFQPWQYLPVLAERWGCIKGGRIDPEAYVRALVERRTLANGWLGINLHGEHLPIFARFRRYFPAVRAHYVHLERLDRVTQAVSWEIAAQTAQWSSKFQTRSQAQFRFFAIRDKLRRIDRQRRAIARFLRGQEYVHLHYEALAATPARAIARLPLPRGTLLPPAGSSTLARQSGEMNRLWRDRFISEFPIHLGTLP